MCHDRTESEWRISVRALGHLNGDACRPSRLTWAGEAGEAGEADKRLVTR